MVVSITPLHALAAGAMAGIGAPRLLLSGAASPHLYSLRPSELRALHDADLGFWIGPELESFLVKPLRGLPARVRVVGLLRAPEITPLPRRGAGDWSDLGPDEPAALDPHLWLDPRNAMRIVELMAAALSEIDPARAAAYRANRDRLLARLAALDDALERTLAPLRAVPYLVFHDAYRYFETRYGLNARGAVAADPERQPGAKRIRALRRTIAALDLRCLFVEPQFRPKLARALTEGLAVRTATLDPLGADLAPGAGAYVRLMHALAEALAACLE